MQVAEMLKVSLALSMSEWDVQFTFELGIIYVDSTEWIE